MTFYTSTRDDSLSINAKQAILKGLSFDGGLFIPKEIKKINDIYKLKDLNYIELATEIIKQYFEEFNIKSLIEKAYINRFNDVDITPLKKVNDIYFLELFHGPTSAFKDLALQFLPQILSECLDNNQNIKILSATSGDTGKAALEGFKNVKGTKITVLYPYKMVSTIQESQMLTSEGENIEVIGIKGNFDDCQRLVKDIFNRKKNNLTSANSINIARLIPQIVYYFKAYFDLLNNNEIIKDEKIDFVVPTGNFGDILAGYFAKKMGLPIDKLVCASNKNNVLTDFINTGIYNCNRVLYNTSSPSIDILVSSNLERLLYLKSKDSSYINELMTDLKNKKEFVINKSLHESIKKDFLAYYSNEELVKETIKEYFEKYDYLMDTHTAVAVAGSKQYETNNKKVILSTASPYKFSKDVYYYLTDQKISDTLDAMDILYEYTKINIPKNLLALKNLKSRFNEVIEKDDINYLMNKLEAYND